jgi:transposase
MLVFSDVTKWLVIMYVDTATYIRSGKAHKRYLLRESFRENGKIKKKTIASLCKLKQEDIDALKLALKYKKDLQSLQSIKEASVMQGKSYGAILVLQKIAKEMGITNALGNTDNGRMALWQVIGRALFQGSRLSLVRATEIHEAKDLFGIPENLTANMLYSNLSWIEQNQEEMEKRLQKTHGVKQNKDLYLYDVTSSYLEGECNELAEYGYNRDKKKGKKQIVIGLLTNSEGLPVATRVFKGNTSDSKTVNDQIDILKNQFGVKKVVLVGDRAMFSKERKEEMPDNYSYITALKKIQIESLIKKDVLQLSLFDKTLEEVEDGEIRYILRCNPYRKEEIENARKAKIESIKEKIEERNKYLKDHPKAKSEVALKSLQEYCKKLTVDKFVEVSVKDGVISHSIKEKEFTEISKLDGCYCLTTDLTKEDASKETIHDRYKDLAFVEHAFRTMKQSHLEIRPLYLRREDRTRAHVFVTMLAYMIERKLSEYWKEVELTVKEGLDALTTVITGTIEIANIKINTTIKPTGICKKLFSLAKVTIPNQIGIATAKMG